MTKPIYKAGDTVTVKLDAGDAAHLNDSPCGFHCATSQIIAHEPKPSLLDEAEERLTFSHIAPGISSELSAMKGVLHYIIQYLKEQEQSK